MPTYYAQVTYTGDGSTTQYSITFNFLDSTHIKAFIDGVETSAFTVSSSTLTFTTAPANSAVIKIERQTPIDARLVDFTDGSVLTESDLDKSADQNFYVAQEIKDDQENNLRLDTDDKFNAQSKVIKNVADPVNNNDAVNKQFISTNLPNITTVAGIASNVTTVAGISSNVTTVANNNTNVSTVATNITSINTVATNIADVITVANDLNEAISEIETTANDLNEAVSEIDTVGTNITSVQTVGDAITNVNTVATNIANVNSVAGNQTNINAVNTNSSNINTVAGQNTNITTLAGINSDITTVAGISANVTTVAGISADVTTVAGDTANIGTISSNLNGTDTIGTVANNIGNVNTVGGAITNVNTVAGNNANITTVAGNNANITTVAGISADVTTVATNNANVTAVAGNASNINSVAGNSTNINAVASNETNINAVNTNSTNINTVAGAISNVNAVGTNITNVNTVASNLASVNNFGEVYRISATAPTTSLDNGDMWFDTNVGKLKIWNGSSFDLAGSSINGTSARYKFTATASQTTFTGTDDNGNTLNYDSGFIDVYLNGVHLDPSDYTATDGSNIVLSSGATVNDELYVVGFGTFSVADFDASGLTGTINIARLADASVTNAKLANSSITINGSSVSLGGSVSVGTTWESKSSAFTAEVGKAYFVDTSSSALTATLPASATIGDEIRFLDVSGTFDTNNLTVGRNSHNIQGSASDLTVATERAGFALVYYNATQGWLIKDK